MINAETNFRLALLLNTIICAYVSRSDLLRPYVEGVPLSHSHSSGWDVYEQYCFMWFNAAAVAMTEKCDENEFPWNDFADETRVCRERDGWDSYGADDSLREYCGKMIQLAADKGEKVK